MAKKSNGVVTNVTPSRPPMQGPEALTACKAPAPYTTSTTKTGGPSGK